MKKLWKTISYPPALVIFACFLLFLPGFTTYFSQDDFIHLSYSQNLGEVVSAFNLFQKGDFPFYRPIPTQVYYYINRLTFGLNPIGYHLINFIIFSINILLLYELITLVTGQKKAAAISIIVFSINSTHFAPLYSPAYVHELMYVLFGILSTYFFVLWIKKTSIKYYFFAMVFLILALLSKETAVVLTPALFVLYLFLAERNLKKIIRTFLLPVSILMVYLAGHFLFYGLANGPSYQLIVGKQNLNILGWYFLWALSTPNILIDFIGPGLKINKVFFQVASSNGLIYLILFPVFTILIIFLFVKWFKKSPDHSLFLMGFVLFIIGLIPLIVFPLHKLATEQAFSLIWLSMSLGILLSNFLQHKKLKYISVLVIFIYIIIAVNSVLLAERTHWIARSAYEAKSVISYFKKHYPGLSDNSIIYFENGIVKIPAYGSSKQLYFALGNGVGLNIILNKPNLKLYFEDINPPPHYVLDGRVIHIKSSDFLGY